MRERRPCKPCFFSLLSVSVVSVAQATFVGDFAPPQAPVELSGKYLLVPEMRALSTEAAAAHPQLKHGGGPEDWMLLDKTHFALDGTVCNKIGVGYSAFRHQSGKTLATCLPAQAALRSARVGDARLWAPLA